MFGATTFGSYIFGYTAVTSGAETTVTWQVKCPTKSDWETKVPVNTITKECK